MMVAAACCCAGWCLRCWYDSRRRGIPSAAIRGPARKTEIPGLGLRDRPWTLTGAGSGTCGYELKEVLGGHGDVCVSDC